jgi:SAM-dependent methyltransferase
VTGIDMAPEMLAAARAKAAGLPAAWVEADARSFDLGRRFRLAIMAAHAFQHLLGESDQRAAAATIRRHLEPGGVFAFDARNPEAHDLRDIFDEERWHTFRDSVGRAVTVTGLQRWDAASRILVYTTIRRCDGTSDHRDLSIYFGEISGIADLLHDVGFTDVSIAGGYAGEPFDRSSSPEAVFTVRY